MNIFVVNCGSSSIKYQLINMTDESVLAKGVMERVGTDEAVLKHSPNGEEVVREVEAPNHAEGMKHIIAALVDPEIGVIKSVDEIQGVGHRVVHGGEKIAQPSLIDDSVIDVIRENAPFSPLHNPVNLMGIEASLAAMPNTPNVAVFDTAFLSTLPAKAYRYAVPADWYRKYHVRKYGFHGTSHQYVTAQAAKILNKPVDQVNLITAHMGNGCSITAIAGGKAVDHSMGLTPLEGLMMGTRCGDLDPAVVYYMTKQGMSVEEVDTALNKDSGLLGVSELTNDMRDLLEASNNGNEKAKLAVEMFIYRVVKYIGSYMAAVPNLDAIIFTGGIGENSRGIRKGVCESLAHLGAKYDEDRNNEFIRGKCGPITTDDSALPIWIVPTNEELMIARDTAQLVTKG